MIRSILAGIATLGLAGCLSTGPVEAGIGAEFELAPNQSVKVIGTNWTVGFRGVSTDTRCPIDRFCVVAGDAGIQIDVFGSSADNPLVLSPNPPNDHWSDAQFRLRVTDLAPPRTDDSAISPGDYRVRLVVEPLGS